MSLEIRVLGQFDVLRDGEPVEIQSRPSQSLLAYLALNPEIAHRREKLSGMLWPDSDEKNARANLRHALWRLRKAVGDDLFETDKVTIQFHLSDEVALDAARLQADWRDSDPVETWIEVLEETGGELLPGFYDEWVPPERERLEALYERRVERLLQTLEDEARWDDVEAWAEQLISLNRTSEFAYRSLMQAAHQKGEAAGVGEAYDRCLQALRDELDVTPSAETRALLERLTSEEEPGEFFPSSDVMADRWDVFLSFKTEDNGDGQIDKLRDVLEGWGLSVYMAGNEPGEKSVLVVDGSQVVVVALSARSAASQRIRREIGLAQRRQLPIVPVELEGAAVEAALTESTADALAKYERFPYAMFFTNDGDQVRSRLEGFVKGPSTVKLANPLKTIPLPEDKMALLKPRGDHTRSILISYLRQTIGRGSSADVRLDPYDSEHYVSREHAVLYLEGGEWMLLTSEKSGNPTAVNAVIQDKGSICQLAFGDELTFGGVTFKFEYAKGS